MEPLGCNPPPARLAGGDDLEGGAFPTAGELRVLAEEAGLSVTAIRGAVFYPPVGILARVLAPLDAWLGRLYDRRRRVHRTGRSFGR